MKSRIHADGWLDLSDRRRVRMPTGGITRKIDPLPEAEALAFLLSHTFPGHRKIVKTMSESERVKIRLALWSESVSERMSHVDRVWRSITEPVAAPENPDEPELIQVVQYGDSWSYPIYLDGRVTRVLPHGGVASAAKGKRARGLAPQLDLKSA